MGIYFDWARVLNGVKQESVLNDINDEILPKIAELCRAAVGEK